MDLEAKCVVKAVMPWARRSWAQKITLLGVTTGALTAPLRTLIPQTSPVPLCSSGPCAPKPGMQILSLSFGSNQGLQIARNFPWVSSPFPLNLFLIADTSVFCVMAQREPHMKMQAAQIGRKSRTKFSETSYKWTTTRFQGLPDFTSARGLRDGVKTECKRAGQGRVQRVRTCFLHFSWGWKCLDY